MATHRRLGSYSCSREDSGHEEPCDAGEDYGTTCTIFFRFVIN